jgi:arylsulfatase A-like enzyme
MNRREFLKTGSAVVAGAGLLPGLASAQTAGTNPRRPNIIVVVADDVTPAYLGCYGGRTPTPHLDRLAADGVRFEQAHCTSPLCNPTRYSMLTGQYPGRNPNAYGRAPEGEQYWLGQTTVWTAEDPSIARTLTGAGYTTGYVGKWHSNFELGTDLQWPEGMDPDDPESDEMLRERHATHIAAIQELSGFDHVSNLVVGNLDRKARQSPKAGHHNPEWQTEGALDFITSAAKEDRPFFLHLANSIPHSPDVLASLEQDTRYTQAGMLDEPLRCHPPRHTVIERLAAAGLNTSGPLASINAGTIMLDDQLGVLRHHLAQLGIADNTMVVWLADHSIYGKGTVYVPGSHVPMIAAWPAGLPAGAEVETAVSLVDLFRTCVSAAGGELPDDLIDGEDILPLMRGQEYEHRPVFMEVNWFRGLLREGYHYVAFRPPPEVLRKMESGEIDVTADQGWGNYRNIFGDLNAPFKPAYFEPDQLYDLSVDPFERRNLANLPAYADKVRHMQAELARILATFERPFPLEVPPFMQSPRYAQLVANRMQIAEQREHYPEPYDAERIYNLNLRDPLAD